MMGKLPERIKTALATSLFDLGNNSIEERRADEHLAWIERSVDSHRALDIEVAGYPDHAATLARCARELLAIGEIDAAIGVAIHLGEVMADDEAHSHFYYIAANEPSNLARRVLTRHGVHPSREGQRRQSV